MKIISCFTDFFYHFFGQTKKIRPTNQTKEWGTAKKTDNLQVKLDLATKTKEELGKQITSLQQENREMFPQYLMAKNATVEVYAKKVVLLEESSGSKLDDIRSRWEGTTVFENKTINIQHHSQFKENQQLITGWKVYYVKVLTIREGQTGMLEERLLMDNYYRKLKEVSVPELTPEPLEPNKEDVGKITWPNNNKND